MSFNPSRTKVQLKLAITRIKALQAKKAQASQIARREIANLLDAAKEESARIRVEHIIREDYNMEAMEILELYCELLLARFGLLETMRHCDQAIAESVNTIIYAAPRSEVKELNLVRDQLIARFGKEFALNAMENRNDVVNSRIIQKLMVQTPDPDLVTKYLTEIAKAYNVQWESGSGLDDLISNDLLGLEPNIIDENTPYNPKLQQLPLVAPVQKVSPKPQRPMPDFPTVPSPPSTSQQEIDHDDLARRFEQLKKNKK